MTTVKDLADWMEEFAPRRLSESWDNVGLLWGDPASEVSRVMTCLTVSPRTADEAIAERAEAIVSHHPVLFKAVKSIRSDRFNDGFLWRLARANIAILSPHTAFDNTIGGINDGLANRIGLTEIGPLRPAQSSGRFKVVVFVPSSDREEVRSAAFSAGAGKIGAYEECSFGSPGFGTFFGTVDSNPAIGQSGRREVVREWKLEFVCPSEILDRVLSRIRSIHPYEEPAIDAYPIHSDVPSGPGVGRLGRLPEPEPLADFAIRVALCLKSDTTQYVGDPERLIRRVALCCGAGDDFLGDAARLGADVLLTGEARYHRAVEAESMGIGLVVAGHHSTERPGVEDLSRRVAGRFPDLVAWASRIESDPLRPTKIPS
ncbi:Nif3-like dinuclear metal center hexameric protein [Tundrisphaera lichenicola]|uniref:Nif3-like dinuclear metal center hexameric protein n=1 Tax=Tundrisphaera lichenicola TaxID=2029860 RepID=UPI003EBFE828